MGGASSGGSDNDVSGAEAVATGGTTYSSKKTKDVNKIIADTNQRNRDDRKNIIEKVMDNNILNKIGNSKFIQDNNYKRRVAFAKKSGKFNNTDLESREFVMSKGFRRQLDGLGYSDPPGDQSGGGNDKVLLSNTPVRNAVAEAPTNAEITQAQSTASSDSPTMLSAKDRKLATNKKGRTDNLLTSASGLGDNNLVIKKNKLGAA